MAINQLDQWVDTFLDGDKFGDEFADSEAGFMVGADSFDGLYFLAVFHGRDDELACDGRHVSDDLVGGAEVLRGVVIFLFELFLWR